MPLTSLPALVDSDIGRPKVELPAIDPNRDYSSAELERIKRWIVALGAEIGLTDGTTPSSINARLALPDPLYGSNERQDFVGPLIEDMYATTLTGAGAAATWAAFLQAVAGHPGVVSLQTGTTTTGVAALFALSSLNASTVGWRKIGASAIHLRFIFSLYDLSTVGEEYIARIGFANDASAPTAGVWAEYDRLTSANWRIKTTVGPGAATSTVPVTTGWHLLEIVVAADGASVELLMDGVTLGTLTEAFAGYAVCSSMFSIVKSAGTTTRAMDVDYCDVYETFTSPRNT